MTIAELGLLFVIIAWGWQYFTIRKGGNKINMVFVVLYAVGLAFLIVDGFSSNMRTLAYLNTLALVASLLVLTKIRKA